MTWDWPVFPAKVHHFIETGEVMHSVRVGKPKLVKVEVEVDIDLDREPLELEWWEICLIGGCGLMLVTWLSFLIIYMIESI